MTNQEFSREKNLILVIGTGGQPPYGIGEIMETYPNTQAGEKRALRYVGQWHKPPQIIFPDEISGYSAEYENIFSGKSI